MASDKGSESATKRDLESVRNELIAKFDKVAMAVVKNGARIDSVEQSLVDLIERNTSRLLNSLDAILVDHEDSLRDHGRRLTRLEIKS